MLLYAVVVISFVEDGAPILSFVVGCILANKSAEIVEKVVSSAQNCNVNESYDLQSSLTKENPCNSLWFSRRRAVARIESQPANRSVGHTMVL